MHLLSSRLHHKRLLSAGLEKMCGDDGRLSVVFVRVRVFLFAFNAMNQVGELANYDMGSAIALVIDRLRRL